MKKIIIITITILLSSFSLIGQTSLDIVKAKLTYKFKHSVNTNNLYCNKNTLMRKVKYTFKSLAVTDSGNEDKLIIIYGQFSYDCTQYILVSDDSWDESGNTEYTYNFKAEIKPILDDFEVVKISISHGGDDYPHIIFPK